MSDRARRENVDCIEFPFESGVGGLIVERSAYQMIEVYVNDGKLSVGMYFDLTEESDYKEVQELHKRIGQWLHEAAAAQKYSTTVQWSKP